MYDMQVIQIEIAYNKTGYPDIICIRELTTRVFCIMSF